MDIPGHRIQREIGRGASSRVLLAQQSSALGGSVAIKVVEPPLADRPGFRERFLRIGEQARHLDHASIVRVFDTGAMGDSLYQVTEYIRGGDLNANLQAGLHMQSLVLAMRDIALGLDYLHGRGIAHGNVKPGNILFREQGTALLADFVFADALGDAIDAAADFDGLGRVFHLMLTGESPPADARNAAAPRAEVRLPLQSAPFEAILSRLLASRPEDRFHSGAEIAAALDEMRGSGLVPDAVARTAPVTAAEVDAAATAAGTELAQPAGEPASDSLRRALPRLALGALAIIALGAGGWYASTQDGLARALALAGLAEHPDVAIAWSEAEALRRDPNQDLAAIIAAYERVQDLDAGHAEAAVAIDGIAAQWTATVEASLDDGDFGLADAKLSEFAAVFPADAGLAALYSRLGGLRQAERLLVDTKRLLARSGLSDAASADAAIATYKEVLRLAPGNADALAGLDEIARHYGALAARSASFDIAAAMESLRRADSANPAFAGAAAVRATLSAAEAVQAEIDASLMTALELRESGALISPPGANPLEIYRRVLATDPNNAIAVQGLSEITAQVLARFDAMLAGGALEPARTYRDQAAASGIDDDAVAEMSARFDAELRRIDTVTALIAQAEALYAQGYVTGPSQDDNAVGRLREALRLDPDHPDAQRLLSVAATRLAEVAVEAYAAGLTEEGLQYLDLALAVTPGIARWREQRERWQEEIAARTTAGGASSDAAGATGR